MIKIIQIQQIIIMYNVLYIVGILYNIKKNQQTIK